METALTRVSARPPARAPAPLILAAIPAGRILRQFYFFMVPPGLVASPFFSAEPAVSAPWVLASFPDGIELVELPLAPVVPERTEDIQPSAASRISSN